MNTRNNVSTPHHSFFVPHTHQRDATPLHHACVHRHPEVVSYLLTCGADINLQNDVGIISFHFLTPTERQHSSSRRLSKFPTESGDTAFERSSSGYQYSKHGLLFCDLSSHALCSSQLKLSLIKLHLTLQLPSPLGPSLKICSEIF